jgi:glycerophosphoryl diester phosphodiesterase
MRVSIKYMALTLMLLVISCDISVLEAPIPYQRIEDELKDCMPLPYNAIKALEGIYNVTDGMLNFGDSIVVKSNNCGISIFCEKNASFMVLDAGYCQDKIILAGYWRYVESSDIGFIKLLIDDSSTVNSILNDRPVSDLSLLGTYNFGKDKPIAIHKMSDLPENDLLIIGHRGGGRNTERYSYSENSLEMIKYAEKLGANGVEIDVQITKDGIPVLFHDSYMSKRLVREDYFIGEISDYTFAQLRSFCTLINGEKIPTLEEALQTIILETTLKFVWIDVKYTGAMEKIATLQTEYLSLAEQFSRNVEIMIGLPDEDLLNEYIGMDDFESHPSLCELSEEFCIKAKSKIWAPNWSLGYLDQRVIDMQQKGFRVITWTLDEPAFIKKFILKTGFNGILTNYPTIVSYEYFTK